MNAEQQRLLNKDWKKWGPYVSNRQWATVREDYSDDGQAWLYTTYETALSKVYRWGEDGIGGISDDQQRLCFSLALWNKNDLVLKERLFGLTNREGNHGEDVKELYYYLDSTPTHSYMKMLYKYPINEFPYKKLYNENAKSNRTEPEYELIDTGIFDNNEYFDVEIEYAKHDVDDVLIRFTIHNRSNQQAALNVLPTIWFRNTWNWGDDNYKPFLKNDGGNIKVIHKNLPQLTLFARNATQPLFCNNETNVELFYNKKRRTYYKDGINDFVLHNKQNVLNKKLFGTKAAFNYDITVEANSSEIIELRLALSDIKNPFENFEQLFNQRKQEADDFYADIQKEITTDDIKLVQRQALAGMMWNKQFYYYDVDVWANGDPSTPVSPYRKNGRNHRWMHLHNADIISMPDKWEYPWYAAWDLAFHCIPLARIDTAFAKEQLLLLTKERYMHPNGQLPAYEWDFSDVNPPVHAWAAWEVYRTEKLNNNNVGDIRFLETIFHKLLINFTWWVNRKDAAGNNIFQGGFLGLDNIGVFDRNSQLANGTYIEQADGTSWMAMFSLNMLRISLELSNSNDVYQDMATKFFEHFLYIAGAMSKMGEGRHGLWDESDGFFYDQLRDTDGTATQLKVRSMVGLIPLFAVEVLDDEQLMNQPLFKERMEWFLNNRPDLAELISMWQRTNEHQSHLLSLVRTDEIVKILKRMLDETEFLSEFGIRSLSKFHKENAYEIRLGEDDFHIPYTPGESLNDMFGGNSNWRGPIWMPLNYMLIESLKKFHHYYHDNLKVECPTNSGNYLSLKDVALEIANRLSKLFLVNEKNQRTFFGDNEMLQNNEHFKNNLMFYEYFNGDTGKGLGAMQQTGWTGLIAELMKRM